jgi:hypothetical protein
VGPGVSPEDAEKIYGEWLNLRWYAENCNNPKLKGLMVGIARQGGCHRCGSLGAEQKD